MSIERRAGGEHASSDSSSARNDPLMGALVNGKFRVKAAIARGGMGRIYYALQEPLGRPVALKVVEGDGDNEHESQFLKRFVQEASILAKLQHPNVVTLFDYGRIEGRIEQYFIAMEYLAGETLAERMKQRGVMSPQEVLVLTRQIARGLREAHVRGIVHRDLKPSNIVLVREADGTEMVKLVDFGIGKVMELGGEQDLTQDGFVVGTPRYMAPEQFDGTAVPASDLYALGSIMYQGLAGRLPFKGTTLSEFMVAKFAQEIPRIREMNPAVLVPESLEGLIFHLLAKNPDERPTMAQLFDGLAHCEIEVFGASAAITGANRAWSSAPLPSLTPGSLPHVQAPPSNPPTGSGIRPSVERLRVPYTQVAPASSLGLTPPPTARSGSPPAPAPRSSRAVGIAAAILLPLLAIGGGALYWVNAHARPANKDTSTPATSLAPRAAEPPAGAGASGSESFTLMIDSTPPGATVAEGDRVLGTTPMQLSIDRASVAKAPRTFVIQKDGYLATSVVQGSSHENVHLPVTLAQDPAQNVKSPAATDRRPTGGTATVARPPPVQPPSGTDIRLKR